VSPERRLKAQRRRAQRFAHSWARWLEGLHTRWTDIAESEGWSFSSRPDLRRPADWGVPQNAKTPNP
jgi:hypothetical protein